MKKKKRILKAFREFCIRGNVIDMVVGFIVGAAFTTVVKSLVDDIIMPPLGFVLGKIDFTNQFLTLNGEVYPTLSKAKEAGAITLNYGVFLNHLISFLLVSFVVFLLVRYINKLKRQEDVKSIAPSQKSCPFCYSSISIKATRCSHCTSQLAEPVS